MRLLRTGVLGCVFVALGCSSSHVASAGGSDAGEASGTRVSLHARLPGAQVTVAGLTDTIADRRVSFTVEPPLTDTPPLVVRIDAAGRSFEETVDVSPDFREAGIDPGSPLARLTMELVRDGRTGDCHVGGLGGSTGGLVWSGDSGYPVAPCEPFGLVRFRLTESYGPCPPDSDCSGFTELLADGTLRADRLRDPDGGVHEATVTPAELAEARLVLTDPTLVDVLASPTMPCTPPTDVFETMELDLVLERFENSTSTCDSPPLTAARDVLSELADRYFGP